MPTHLLEQSFDPWQELQRFEQERLSDVTRHGASCQFIGSMRDLNEGDDVAAMLLEHYPGMTEQHLNAIETEARERWPLIDVLIMHRVGSIYPSEPIVLTAAWSQHRGAAFEACRYLIEELKHRAPFWKKETLSNGSERWVEHNTAG